MQFVILEMSFAEKVCLEIIKTCLNLITAFVVAIFAGVVGQQLTLFWNIRQKRRELDLSLLNQFYELYGEGLSIYRLWNLFKDNEEDLIATSPTIRWELLERASRAEASMEAIFVKLASERKLTDNDIESLGRFRQKFQTFRKSIKNNQRVPWYASNVPEYSEFKKRACEVANLLLQVRSEQPKILNLIFSKFFNINTQLEFQETPNMASEQLRHITANKWEDGYYFREPPKTGNYN